MSVVALVGAAADGGAGLLLPAHYAPASASERGQLFGSLIVFAGAGAIASALFLVSLWIWQVSPPSVQPASLAAIALSAVLMPMRAISNISVMVFSVTDRGVAIAAQMAIQAIVVFLGTLTALFGFSMGGTSLFIGAVCGQFAALCVGLLVLGHHRELSLPSRHWLQRITTGAWVTGASGVVDGVHGFGENAMLTSASGLHAVGILNHARVYYSLLMAFGSAVSHNVWAKSLEDARNLRSNFEMTRRAWSPVQIAFASAGIVFTFVGEEIVNIISSGTFTQAAAYIPALFIIALIQTTEQPANAIVCASGRGAAATWLRTIMTLGGLIVLYPTIVVFGISWRCYDMHYRSFCISPIPTHASKPGKNSSVSRSCRRPWNFHNSRRDGVRALGSAAADHSTRLDDDGHRDAHHYWPSLNQRDDLDDPPDPARAASIDASMCRHT